MPRGLLCLCFPALAVRPPAPRSETRMVCVCVCMCMCVHARCVDGTAEGGGCRPGVRGAGGAGVAGRVLGLAQRGGCLRVAVPPPCRHTQEPRRKVGAPGSHLGGEGTWWCLVPPPLPQLLLSSSSPFLSKDGASQEEQPIGCSPFVPTRTLRLPTRLLLAPERVSGAQPEAAAKARRGRVRMTWLRLGGDTTITGASGKAPSMLVPCRRSRWELDGSLSCFP